jgi:hypothetical protein
MGFSSILAETFEITGKRGEEIGVSAEVLSEKTIQ